MSFCFLLPEFSYFWKQNLKTGRIPYLLLAIIHHFLNYSVLISSMKGTETEIKPEKQAQCAVPHFLCSPTHSLKYNQHVTLCKFKVYSVSVWYICIFQYDYRQGVTDTSVISLGCQQGRKEIRAVRTWGGEGEKEEGPWSRSVEEQIGKVIGFAGHTVSVKSCSESLP